MIQLTNDAPPEAEASVYIMKLASVVRISWTNWEKACKSPAVQPVAAPSDTELVGVTRGSVLQVYLSVLPARVHSFDYNKNDQVGIRKDGDVSE